MFVFFLYMYIYYLFIICGIYENLNIDLYFCVIYFVFIDIFW